MSSVHPHSVQRQAGDARSVRSIAPDRACTKKDSNRFYIGEKRAIARTEIKNRRGPVATILGYAVSLAARIIGIVLIVGGSRWAAITVLMQRNMIGA